MDSQANQVLVQVQLFRGKINSKFLHFIKCGKQICSRSQMKTKMRKWEKQGWLSVMPSKFLVKFRVNLGSRVSTRKRKCSESFSHVHKQERREKLESKGVIAENKRSVKLAAYKFANIFGKKIEQLKLNQSNSLWMKTRWLVRLILNTFNVLFGMFVQGKRWSLIQTNGLLPIKMTKLVLISEISNNNSWFRSPSNRKITLLLTLLILLQSMS